MTMRKIGAIIFAALCLVSCDKYYFRGMIAPEGETVDERFAQSMESNSASGPVSVRAGSDDYRFYVITDVHLDGSSRHLDSFVSKFLQDGNRAPMLLCLGDLVNGKREFSEFSTHVKPIADAGDRIFCCAGNHDLYWGRWSSFRKEFGSSTYCFDVLTPSSARDLFICLESGGGTLGGDQRAWLENLLATRSSSYRNVIVFTHTHFFMRDFSQGHTSNYPVEETYDLADLFSRHGVDLVLTGHDHSREDVIFRGVRYVIVDALEDIKDVAGYAVVSSGTDIDVKFVDIN